VRSRVDTTPPTAVAYRPGNAEYSNGSSATSKPASRNVRAQCARAALSAGPPAGRGTRAIARRWSRARSAPLTALRSRRDRQLGRAQQRPDALDVRVTQRQQRRPRRAAGETDVVEGGLDPRHAKLADDL
jgi:hypothetical protein